MTSRLKGIESELGRIFRAKKKYSKGNYAIFLTNQFYKDQFVDYVNKRMTGVESVISSGSIKKCKGRITEKDELQAVGTNL